MITLIGGPQCVYILKSFDQILTDFPSPLSCLVLLNELFFTGQEINCSELKYIERHTMVAILRL